MLWNQVQVDHQGANIKHLLWTLHFYKAYQSDIVMQSVFESTQQTIEHWIRTFTGAIAELKSVYVSEDTHGIHS